MGSRLNIHVAVFLLCQGILAAQTNQALVLDPGVPAHKEIDEIYRIFSLSYEKLDPAMVSNLYGPDALYLAPGRDVEKGRAKIHETFKGFFDWAKGKGRSFSVSFRIVERVVKDDLGYDVGIYTLKGTGGGMADGTDIGKFIVVTRKDKNGGWYFQVDGYSSMKPEN